MSRHWTFGRKVAVTFAVVVALSIVMGAVAVVALRTVVASKDRVIDVNAQLLIDAERLHTRREAKAAGARGWMVKPFKPDLLLATVRRYAGSA